MFDQQTITNIVRSIIVSLAPATVALIGLAIAIYKNGKKVNKELEAYKLKSDKEIADLKAELTAVVIENNRSAEMNREYRRDFDALHRNNTETYGRLAMLEAKVVGYDKCMEKLAEFEEENSLLKARVASLERLGPV